MEEKIKNGGEGAENEIKITWFQFRGDCLGSNVNG
jgi:hypothetical protein